MLFRSRKDWRWAQLQLRDILKLCCTFDKKTTTYEDVEEIVTEENVQVFNDDGTPKMQTVKKKIVTVTKECTLTDEQAKFVGKMAEEFAKKAIEKSKLFLATAIKATGATLIQFQGEDGYLVEGALRKYVVNARTNQVYNYESKGYVCIVEPGHQVNVGFDALAARLYALKNDSVLVGQIGTLRHA